MMTKSIKTLYWEVSIYDISEVREDSSELEGYWINESVTEAARILWIPFHVFSRGKTLAVPVALSLFPRKSARFLVKLLSISLGIHCYWYQARNFALISASCQGAEDWLLMRRSLRGGFRHTSSKIYFNFGTLCSTFPLQCFDHLVWFQIPLPELKLVFRFVVIAPLNPFQFITTPSNEHFSRATQAKCPTLT